MTDNELEIAELLGTINRLTGERDRARETAIRLLWEADIAQSGQAMVYQMTGVDAYRAGIREAIDVVQELPVYRWYDKETDQYEKCVMVDVVLVELCARVQGEK